MMMVLVVKKPGDLIHAERIVADRESIPADYERFEYEQVWYDVVSVSHTDPPEIYVSVFKKGGVKIG